MLYRLTKNGELADPKRPTMNRAAAMIVFENLRVRSAITKKPFKWTGVRDTVHAEFFGDQYLLEPIQQEKRSA